MSDIDTDTPDTVSDRDRMLDEAYASCISVCENEDNTRYSEHGDLDEMYVDAMHGTVMFRDNSPD